MSDIDSIHLKECPFCGSNMNNFPKVSTVKPCCWSEYLRWKRDHQKIIGSDAGYIVYCLRCGAQGARGMTKKEAIERWNCRGKPYINLDWQNNREE